MLYLVPEGLKETEPTPFSFFLLNEPEPSKTWVELFLQKAVNRLFFLFSDLELGKVNGLVIGSVALFFDELYVTRWIPSPSQDVWKRVLFSLCSFLHLSYLNRSLFASFSGNGVSGQATNSFPRPVKVLQIESSPVSTEPSNHSVFAPSPLPSL